MLKLRINCQNQEEHNLLDKRSTNAEYGLMILNFAKPAKIQISDHKYPQKLETQNLWHRLLKRSCTCGPTPLQQGRQLVGLAQAFLSQAQALVFGNKSNLLKVYQNLDGRASAGLSWAYVFINLNFFFKSNNISINSYTNLFCTN